MKSTRGNGCWMSWSLFAIWLAAVVLVIPAGAEEFSMTGCLARGGEGGRIDVSRYFACQEAQREYEVSRYKEAVERERQRRATEEATRQQDVEAQAQAREAADRAAKARQEAERTRKAEEVERARKAEADRARKAEADRARKAAEEIEAARLQEVQRRRAAEQFMPGMCPLGDLTAKCAMSSPDPVVEQIRRSQENAAGGRPSR